MEERKRLKSDMRDLQTHLEAELKQACLEADRLKGELLSVKRVEATKAQMVEEISILKT